MFLKPDLRALCGDQFLKATFESRRHINSQFPSQSQQLRIDGDVRAGFTAFHVYIVMLSHTH
jgi:hypothetical protein